MVREGVDWSSSRRPDIRAFDQKPIRNFVVRYVSYLGNPKNITKPEADFWKKQGIDIVIVFETTAGRAKMGSAAGKADAVQARQQVKAYGGPADGGVIYFAVDFPAGREEQQMINGYFQGVNSILRPDQVGAYGSHDVISRLVDSKLIHWKFQTYAWSGGIVYPGLNLYQYQNDVPFGGIMVDLDRAYTANFGQWFYEDDGEFVMDDAATKAFNDLATRVDKLGAYLMNTHDDRPAHAGLVDVYAAARNAEDNAAAPLTEAELGQIEERVRNAVKYVLNIQDKLVPPHGVDTNDHLAKELMLHTLTAEMRAGMVHKALDSHAGNLVTKLDELGTAVSSAGSADGTGSQAVVPSPPVDLGPVLAALAQLQDAVSRLPKTDPTVAVAAANAVGTKLEQMGKSLKLSVDSIPKHDVPAIAAKQTQAVLDRLASLTLSVQSAK